VLAAASYTLQKLVVFRQPPTTAMLK